MIINSKDLIRTKDAEDELVQVFIQYIADIVGFPQGEGMHDGTNPGNTTGKEAIDQ